MKTTRYVIVDCGYGHAENLTKVKVLDSQMCKGLFTDDEDESLFVELPNGEHIWVDIWYEEPPDESLVRRL